MTFDPWTLFFQFLNFAVLLFVLYRVVFRPVRRVMEERRTRVAADLDAAEQARRAAEELRADLARQRAQVEQERLAAMEAMRRDVDESRRRLLEAAAGEAQALRDKGRALLETDRQRLEDELKEVAARTVTGWAAGVLRDLADETLHRAILRRFPEELERIAADLAQLPRTGEGLPVRIETAFPLEGAEATALGAAVAARLDGASLTLGTEPGLLAGVRLRARDKLYDLSLRGRLDALAARLREQA
jgi:F-type H+-transporting ATPase subunit b